MNPGPNSPQVGVFSATLPPEALEITRKFMNKPVSAVGLVVGKCVLVGDANVCGLIM